MLPENYNPVYYRNGITEAEIEEYNALVASDPTNDGRDAAIAGSVVAPAANNLESFLAPLPGGSSAVIKVGFQAGGTFLAKEFEIDVLDSTENSYRIRDGKDFAIDVGGETAIAEALRFIGSRSITAFGATGLLAATPLSIVGIVGATAVGAAASYIWSEYGRPIANQVINALEVATSETLDFLGFEDTNIQIVDTQNDKDILIGGAYIEGSFSEGSLDEENELAVIQDLLAQTTIEDPNLGLPSINLGEDRIVIARDNGVTSGEFVTYNIFSGDIVDAVSNEFLITPEALLDLRIDNPVNSNREITFVPEGQTDPLYIFGSDDNRFYVPLPSIESVNPDIVGFYPGNIVYGTQGNNSLDALSSPLTSEDHLLLGLDGNDSITGNIAKDFIFGGSGDDIITDTIANDGDIVFFSDDFENYDISLDENGSTIISHVRGSQTDGTDTVSNIEFAQFRDRRLSLDSILSESEQNGDLVTFRFETQITGTFPNTNIFEEAGENAPLNLEFSFDPNLESTRLFGFDPYFGPLEGELTIGNESTALDNGYIRLGTDGTPRGSRETYNLIFFDDDNGIGRLYGRDITRLTLSFQGELDSLLDSRSNLPVTTDFVQNAELYSINVSLDGDGSLGDRVRFSELQFLSPSESGEVPFTFTSENNVEDSTEVDLPNTTPIEDPTEEETSNSQEDLESEQPPIDENEESTEEPIDNEETSESEEPIPDEEEIVEPPVNEDEPDLENPDSLVDGVPGNNSLINNPQETEIQLQVFTPDLESPITEPLISVIDDRVEYTELSTLELDTTDLFLVDVNIDFSVGTETGSVSFEVDENESSGSFGPAEFNGYVFTDIFDEIPAIENVTLNETANSLGLEASDITFTENTIEVNVEGLAYSPGLNALLDIEFADI